MPRPIKVLAVAWAAVFSLSLLVLAQAEEDATLRLRLGDPRLKDRTMAVGVNEIFSARSSRPMSFPKMIEAMKDARFIYVGESHDNLSMHDIQLRVIQALHEKYKNIAVGLEMLPTDIQPVLDKWTQGQLSREEFIREVRWYIYWSMNFGFYEKIFDFARENKIPVYALNVPREIITKVRMKGWDSLSDEEKSRVPKLDLTSEDHRSLMRTIFGGSDIPHEMKGEGFEKMFEGLYRAQVAWDEIMGANAIRGAERTKGKMIVLAGSGHLIYNLGINRRVYDQNHLPFQTVIAVSVAPPEKDILVSRTLADYAWAIPEEARPAFPSVGLALKKVDGFDNLVIDRKPIDGVALGRDFEKGDVILSVDGRTFADISDLRIYLARFKWDEEAKFRLLRAGEVKEVALKFQEQPPAEMKKDVQASPEKMKAALAAVPKIDRLRRRLESLVRNAEGEVGVSVKHIESGQSLDLNGGTSFPMASVFKLPVFVELMAQAQEGKLNLDEEVSLQNTDRHLGSGVISSLAAPGVRLSWRNLAKLMMMISDNSAADILLEKVGPENINKRLKQAGVTGLSVNRTCQELIMDYAGLDYQKYKGLTLEQVAAEMQKSGERSPEAYRETVLKFGQDPRDQSTPAAMNLLLEKIWKKEILDPQSSSFIISTLLQCQTGEGRIKGRLPPRTSLAHKTGTIAGTVNDAGIIYLPDGLGHVVLTVFTKNFLVRTSQVEEIIAEIGRLVYDFFAFTS